MNKTETTPKGKSILFVDDEKILCETISDDLEEEGFSVTAVTSGQEAIEKFKSQPFDLVITDLIMEDKDGIEITREIKDLNPEAQVMILTGKGSLETAIQALKLEVKDYVLKPVKRDDLLQKIDDCLKEPQKDIPNIKLKPIYNQDLQFQAAQLTPREREVGLLVGEGYNDREIARMLDISEYTVKFHLKRVFKKLNIHKRVELIISMGN